MTDQIIDTPESHPDSPAAGQTNPETPVVVPDADEEEREPTPPRTRRINPVTVFTLLVLLCAAVLFVWHMVADRYTPFTDKARVQAYTVPVTPQVSSYVVAFPVQPNERVRKGQILVELDTRPFELAVRQARAALARAGQEVGAKTSTVEAAAAQVAVAQTRLDRAQRNWDRVQRISKKNPGALSEADRDRAEANLEEAKSELISARANLEKAKKKLGTSGPRNPMIESAVSALDMALYNLSQTTLTAPNDGWIATLPYDVGYFASAGHPLLAFVSAKRIWIEAHMRENNLLHLEPGNPVDIVLDVAPGTIHHGTVQSVGVGVAPGPGANPGDLPVVQQAEGWLRDPQRFPVLITPGEDIPPELLRTGGQADVAIYTGDRPFLNMLARWRIQIAAWLSYVR